MGARWVFYSVLGLFALSLLAGAAAFVVHDYQASVSRIEEQAHEAARAYAVHAQRNIEELRLGLDWLEARINPDALDYGLLRETTAAAELMANALRGVSAFLIIDASARIRFSTIPAAAVGTDVSYREYFAAARDHGIREYLGPASRGLETGRLVYTLSRRVTRNGRFSGVILAASLVGRWAEVIAPVVSTIGAEVRLVDVDGQVLLAQRRNENGGLVPVVPAASTRVGSGEAITARFALDNRPYVAEVIIPRQTAIMRWERRRDWVTAGVALSLGALTVIGVLGHRTMHREALATETAIRRTEALNRALETQTILMAELDHRVKNSLSLAAGILSMQGARSRNEEVREALDSARARIAAIARVHQRLDDKDSPAHISLGEYLRGLCADIATNTGLECRVDAPPIALPTARAVQLGLIVTELLLNTAKYGGKEVDLTARVHNDFVTLTIRDFGSGLPPDFDPERSAGLGMRIVSNLVRQLNGSLAAEDARPGARFLVRVPVHLGSQGSEPAGIQCQEHTTCDSQTQQHAV